jgi:hypothetical protein
MVKAENLVVGQTYIWQNEKDRSLVYLGGHKDYPGGPKWYSFSNVGENTAWCEVRADDLLLFEVFAPSIVQGSLPVTKEIYLVSALDKHAGPKTLCAFADKAKADDFVAACEKKDAERPTYLGADPYDKAGAVTTWSNAMHTWSKDHPAGSSWDYYVVVPCQLKD